MFSSVSIESLKLREMCFFLSLSIPRGLLIVIEFWRDVGEVGNSCPLLLALKIWIKDSVFQKKTAWYISSWPEFLCCHLTILCLATLFLSSWPAGNQQCLLRPWGASLVHRCHGYRWPTGFLEKCERNLKVKHEFNKILVLNADKKKISDTVNCT